LTPNDVPFANVCPRSYKNLRCRSRSGIISWPFQFWFTGDGRLNACQLRRWTASFSLLTRRGQKGSFWPPVCWMSITIHCILSRHFGLVGMGSPQIIHMVLPIAIHQLRWLWPLATWLAYHKEIWYVLGGRFYLLYFLAFPCRFPLSKQQNCFSSVKEWVG